MIRKTPPFEWTGKVKRPRGMLRGFLLCGLFAGQALADCAPVKGQSSTDWPADSRAWLYPTFHLQTSLQKFGVSDITVDGSFGAQSQKALRAFQQQHGLGVTGEPDEATLSHLAAKWAETHAVPPFAARPNTAVVNPDFRASVRAEDGLCTVKVQWADEVRLVGLPLKHPVEDCRLTQFNGVPHYVQMLGTFGIMVSVKSTRYQPSDHRFGVPVVVVYPDRQLAVGIRQFEHYAATLASVTADFPAYQGPYENKVFDFHTLSIRPGDPATSNDNWIWKSWETCGPAFTE